MRSDSTYHQSLTQTEEYWRKLKCNNNLLSTDQKLSDLCNASYCGSKKPSCPKNHETSMLQRENNVVHELPLSSSKKYTGRTGRCTDDKLHEHANNVENSAGHFAALTMAVSLCTHSAV